MSESGQDHPRCVLDAGKRRLIVALVANGSSRRAAAEHGDSTHPAWLCPDAGAWPNSRG